MTEKIEEFIKLIERDCDPSAAYIDIPLKMMIIPGLWRKTREVSGC